VELDDSEKEKKKRKSVPNRKGGDHLSSDMQKKKLGNCGFQLGGAKGGGISARREKEENIMIGRLKDILIGEGGLSAMRGRLGETIKRLLDCARKKPVKNQGGESSDSISEKGVWLLSVVIHKTE